MTRCGPALVMALTLAACGGDSSPTPSSPTPPPTPQPWTLSGRVLSTPGGGPIVGARVEAGSLLATTVDDGRFTLTQPGAPSAPLRAKIEAGGFLARETTLAWPRSGPEPLIDLIDMAPPFSVTLYKQLVRDEMESDELLQTHRWTTRPRVALHPFDDGGRPVPAHVLATIRTTVNRAVAEWSGGQFTDVTVEETEIADDTEGWIVLHILRSRSSEYCGQAGWKYRGSGQIVTASVDLTLDKCGCGSQRISPNTISHEIGHAMGFWHAKGRYVMRPQMVDPCDSFERAVITEAEAFHARIAYNRPPGNKDPDVDPDSFRMITDGGLGRSRTISCGR